MKKYVLAAMLSVLSAGALAGDPAPFPEFTFKMGKPPKAGTAKRITIQIEPGDQATPSAPAKPDDVPGAPVRAAQYDWFWDHIPPGYSDAGALRFETALQKLAQPPAGAAAPRPRLQHIQQIALSQGQNILMATIGTDVSPALVLAVISVESGGRDDALSEKGAQGLMQLIPATATRFGVDDSLAADQNIKGGVAYLDWLLKEFKGDPILALAGYNAGENAVKANEGVPPYPETRDYIPKVLAAYDVARGLCKTRPQFISDGCALNLAMK
ncbi:lytic transglycosylase domain-containing protein [Pseudohalocynthiibacter aestuariivivens]|uniref:Lytic transglycosylase domain-containing protein n=1 Tax=Roseovarius pelagicus TaxID=2980108 RepID=A0ABY6D8N2_9RHOB|nr:MULTISPECIES: lytic transglycosylase domain-containing protein [Rhodobacterales]QIE45600.1 lytic transglycosylase domain-containing protein [Pseudohalocynthiibacter aestuariivivens]UXX82481.1 lytic transglycosylase domain-containing protein [Roseovarius pelagicus]